jgi:small subunit ribosomal protein S17e
MGRIKTKMIKRLTRQLLREHGTQFSQDYAENKNVLSRVAIIKSKKIRNILAGSVARQVKLKKDVQNYAE